MKYIKRKQEIETAEESNSTYLTKLDLPTSRLSNAGKSHVQSSIWEKAPGIASDPWVRSDCSLMGSHL